MIVRIEIGRRWACQEHPSTTMTFDVPSCMAEVEPEAWFDAMQRIGHPVDPDADHDAYDLERIYTKYADNDDVANTLAIARRHIDLMKCPSMSVGDTIEIMASDMSPIIAHECMPIGWASGRDLDSLTHPTTAPSPT